MGLQRQKSSSSSFYTSSTDPNPPVSYLNVSEEEESGYDGELDSDTPVLDAAQAGPDDDEEPCPIWDDECEPEVTLAEILGEDSAAKVKGLPDELTLRSFQVGSDLALAEEAGVDVARYYEHCEGAQVLAAALEEESSRLRASGSYDRENDEFEWDAELEDAVLDLVSRSEASLGILDEVEVLANQDGIRAFAALLDEWATAGTEWISTVIIKAETGQKLMSSLVASFTEHQSEYERHLNDAKMDVVSLVVGPLAKLAGIPESLRRLYTLARAFDKVDSTPDDAWDAVRTTRSIGSAAIGEAMRSLGKDSPWSQAWTPLSTLIKTLQTIVDLGLTGTDLAMMQTDLTFAQEVQAEYGEAMKFVDTAGPTMEAALTVLGRLVGASERVDASLKALEAKVAAAGGTGLYDV